MEEGEVLLVSIREKSVKNPFGILLKRNPKIRLEDVERVIEEVEDNGSL